MLPTSILKESVLFPVGDNPVANLEVEMFQQKERSNSAAETLEWKKDACSEERVKQILAISDNILQMTDLELRLESIGVFQLLSTGKHASGS